MCEAKKSIRDARARYECATASANNEYNEAMETEKRGLKHGLRAHEKSLGDSCEWETYELGRRSLTVRFNAERRRLRSIRDAKLFAAECAYAKAGLAYASQYGSSLPTDPDID